MTKTTTNFRPKDAGRTSWVDSMPASIAAYFRLARYDRPIGIWLLTLPGWMGIVWANLQSPDAVSISASLILAVLILIGAIAMRGAGCTYNDILDHEYDAKVDRTAGRPIPAGQISLKQAWAWTAAQCAIGLAVLLCLPRTAQFVAMGSIPFVLAYPLMKRITWWPQVWLGITLNWAFLVSVAALGANFTIADALFYLGLIFWTVGYDTIYALQDIEDDAVIGVKSTARRFGAHVKSAVQLLYALTILCISAACIIAELWVGLVGVMLFGGHLAIQTQRLSPDMGDHALEIFKSNREAAFILVMGMGLSLLLR